MPLGGRVCLYDALLDAVSQLFEFRATLLLAQLKGRGGRIDETGPRLGRLKRAKVPGDHLMEAIWWRAALTSIRTTPGEILRS